MSRTYRPEVCVLEDRTVPTVLFRQFYALPPTPAPLAANHLIVIVPQNVEAGQNVTVVVKAADATNKVVTSYKGTVNVSLGTSDPSAVIPASFTFSVADQGVHRFTAKLQAVGSQMITVNNSAITGSALLNVNTPVTHFSINTFSSATAGSATLINVVALDANSKPAPGYTGTVHFTTTSFLAYPLPDYTFTAADAGSHLFSVTFATGGSATIAVNDVDRGSLSGATTMQVLPQFAVPNYYGGYYNYGIGYHVAQPVYGYYGYYGPWGWTYY